METIASGPDLIMNYQESEERGEARRSARAPATRAPWRLRPSPRLGLIRLHDLQVSILDFSEPIPIIFSK